MGLLKKIILLLIFTAFILAGLWMIVKKDRAPKGKKLLRITLGDSITEDQVSLFNEKNPSDFLMTTPGSSNAMQILVQTASGAGPALIGDLNETNIITFDSVGLLEDLSKLQKDSFLSKTLYDHVRKSVSVKYLTKNGKLKTKQISYPANVKHLFIIYNKNLFDKYKIPYPNEDLTWDEYITKASRINSFTDERTPEFYGAIGVNPYVLIWEHNGAFFNKAGTACTLNSEEVSQAMLFYNRLIHKFKVEPIQAQTGMDEQKFRLEQFNNGKVGMLWASRNSLNSLRRAIFEQKRNKQEWGKNYPGKPFPGPPPLRLGACLVPRFKNGKRYINFTVDSVGINVKTRQKTQCIRFLKFLSGKTYSESFKTNTNGIPGNKSYCQASMLNNPKFHGEEEVNTIALKSIKYAKMRKRCYFIPTTMLLRNFQKLRFKVATNPKLSVKKLKLELKKLTAKVNKKIKEATEREKYLKKLYNKFSELY